MSITYSECVSVALGIQHAKRKRHIVSCGLSGCNTFFSLFCKAMSPCRAIELTNQRTNPTQTDKIITTGHNVMVVQNFSPFVLLYMAEVHLFTHLLLVPQS